MTKKKVSRKKTASKKKAVAAVDHNNESPVMAHDPLSMLEEAADMLEQGFDEDFDSDLSAITEVAPQQNEASDDQDFYDGDLASQSSEPVAVVEAVEPEPEPVVETVVEPEPEPQPVMASEPVVEPETPVASPAALGFDEIDLGDSLTIAEAEAYKKNFIDFLSSGMPVKIAASEVDSCDGAGLQLLAAFYKEAMSRGIEFAWGKVSKSLYEAAEIMGLIETLGLNDVEIEDDGEGVSWGLF